MSGQEQKNEKGAECLGVKKRNQGTKSKPRGRCGSAASLSLGPGRTGKLAQRVFLVPMRMSVGGLIVVRFFSDSSGFCGQGPVGGARGGCYAPLG